MSRRLIMFDLDGTLLDSQAGITHTLRLTLAECGKPLAPDHDLKWALGASLWKVLEQYLETTDKAAINHAVNTYRHIYRDGPMFEYKVYDGVNSMLSTLKEQDTRIVVATAKAHEYAREIIHTTPFEKYIDHVYGSELDGQRVEKTDLIGYVLEQESVKADDAVMVGDRHHDIDGAFANDVTPIAVAYGYGDRTEYANAHSVADTPADVASTIAKL